MSKSYLITERTGDRGGDGKMTIKPYAFTIPANPMSDRGQMVIEIEEIDNGNAL